MANKLFIVTGSGLLLSAAFLGAAVMIGGDDVFHDARSFEKMKPLIDMASHKTWGWKGGDTLAMDAPINIRYEPKGPPQVSVTGPAELLQHVKVTDGRIATDTSVTRESGKRVEAVVSGMPIRKFVINGGENLDLGEIDQPGLDLHINGTGSVRGRGKVERLKLTIAGPGDADLGGLSVTGDANISILGSGDASLSPHGSVRLFIAGSGDLKLLTKPTELRQTIIGSGEVSQLAGEAAKEALRSVEISRTAIEAARQAVDKAQIQEQVQQQVERQMALVPVPPSPPMPKGNWVSSDPKSGSVFLRGSRDTDLGHIDQQSLKITVANSGSVTAEGKVEDLSITVLGSGDADLGKLVARIVTVQIMGSGDATVAPSEKLTATIMGSGDVRLKTRPAQISRQIMGSGEIIEVH